MIKTNYFNIEELVHPQILKSIGENNSWMRLDAGCLIDLDVIREAWGSSIFVNIGNADSRGLRPPNDPDGAFYSSHKMGVAFDLVPGNGKTKELFELIKQLIENGEILSFNTLEDFNFTPSWVHVAKMNHDKKPLIIRP
ncbi:MAG: hypothetical protein ACPGSO_02925 [Vicingaceae bacterium]